MFIANEIKNYKDHFKNTLTTTKRQTDENLNIKMHFFNLEAISFFFNLNARVTPQKRSLKNNNNNIGQRISKINTHTHI